MGAEIQQLKMFQNGGRQPSWILKIKFSTLVRVQTYAVHQRTKFQHHSLNGCGDMAMLKFLKLPTILPLFALSI